ncbi:MAG TPA: TetR family transcriptional regulator [Polyangiaceae bacterium]|nr:TetR family transcriptional regulator [Polyangiaceae bacterium]
MLAVPRRPGTYDRRLSGAERQARARERLLAAAASCIVERGPRALTANAVIERAGAGRNSFYAQFVDADAVARAVLARAHGVLLAALAERLAEPHTPIERLRALVRGCLEAASGDPPYVRAALLLERTQPPGDSGTLQRRLRRELNEALDHLRTLSVGGASDRELSVAAATAVLEQALLSIDPGATDRARQLAAAILAVLR